MKIDFTNLKFGWINLKIEHNFVLIIDSEFSYIYNALTDLLDSLFQLITISTVETEVIFFGEPFAYKLFFSKRKNIIQFKIYFIESYSENKKSGELIYEKIDNFKEICIPFWRGLRKIQSKYNQEEFNKLWQRDFSYEKLDNLSKIIKTVKT